MSMVTTDYEDSMLHAIAASAPANGVVLRTVLNQALRKLVTAHDWEWRKQGPVGINFVSGQAYCTLPSDFGEGQLLHVAPYSMVNPLAVHKTSLEEISLLRGSLIQTSLEYWVAVSWPTQASTSAAPGQARLEIWPTPATSTTNALRIVYKRGFLALTTDSQVPNIPGNFERALDLMARWMIMSKEFGSGAAKTVAEFAELQEELKQLAEVDGGQEQNLGVITKGAAEPTIDGYQYRHFDPTQVNLHQ